LPTAGGTTQAGLLATHGLPSKSLIFFDYIIANSHFGQVYYHVASSHKLEWHELYNAVFEAAIGYAGACMVQAMDKIARVCERMDVIEDKVGGIREDVTMMEEQLASLRGDVMMVDRKVEETEG